MQTLPASGVGRWEMGCWSCGVAPPPQLYLTSMLGCICTSPVCAGGGPVLTEERCQTRSWPGRASGIPGG